MKLQKSSHVVYYCHCDCNILLLFVFSHQLQSFSLAIYSIRKTRPTHSNPSSSLIAMKPYIFFITFSSKEKKKKTLFSFCFTFEGKYFIVRGCKGCEVLGVLAVGVRKEGH